VTVKLSDTACSVSQWNEILESIILFCQDEFKNEIRQVYFMAFICIAD